MKYFICISLVLFGVVLAERDWSNLSPLDINSFPFVHDNHVNPKIVGGEEVIPHSVPYQAAVMVPVGEKTGFCGGSILSARVILTAAHCVDMNPKPTHVKVVVGAHQIRQNETTQQVFLATKFIVHEWWVRFLLLNDIALVILDEDIQFNENVQPIRRAGAAEEGKDLDGVVATVSGWGKDADSATGVSPVLRSVEASILNSDTCKKVLAIIGAGHLCLNTQGGKSSCSGDSGGPLVIPGEDGVLTQHGIVSFGIAFGCEIGFPAGFTKVSHYDKWITDKIASLDL